MTYDIEQAIRQAARARGNRDDLTRETSTIADRMADGFRGDFGDTLDMETCGKALVIAAGSLVPLCGPEIPGAVLANIVCLAGESLVRQARKDAL